MDKHNLKELLRNISDNNFSVPQGTDPYELSLIILEFIGDTDSELRDDLILTILSRWIDQAVLSAEQCSELLKLALDQEHLFRGIGAAEDDTVFCRTFSVLVVALVIYRHRKEKFLAQSQVLSALAKVLEFYDKDKDVRGYVEGMGWAHGAAHGADALDELARCEEIGAEGLRSILSSIRKKVAVPYYGYIHLEDERMITAVKAVLERNILSVEEAALWIRSFGNLRKTGISHQDQVAECNILLFLKSLYFRLLSESEHNNLITVVKEVILQLGRFYKV